MSNYKRRRRKVASYSYSPRESIATKQKRAYRRITLISVSVVVLLFVLFKYGPSAVERMVSVQNSFDDTQELEVVETDDQLLWTPTIDSPPEETNEPKITITGTAYQGIQVELFFNGDSVSVDDLGEEMKFEFTDLNLDAGENTVAVRAIKESGEESELSEEIIIVLDLVPPTIEITSSLFKKGFISFSNCR